MFVKLNGLLVKGRQIKLPTFAHRSKLDSMLITANAIISRWMSSFNAMALLKIYEYSPMKVSLHSFIESEENWRTTESMQLRTDTTIVPNDKSQIFFP